MDGSVPGDDAIGQGLILFHAEVGAAVGHEGIEFLEAALVQQLLDALPGRELALVVLLLDALLAPGRPGLLAQVREVEDLSFNAHGGSWKVGSATKGSCGAMLRVHTLSTRPRARR